MVKNLYESFVIWQKNNQIFPLIFAMCFFNLNYWTRIQKKKLSKALFIKEQMPTLNEQGQSIPLTMLKILNFNFNIRKWNGSF